MDLEELNPIACDGNLYIFPLTSTMSLDILYCTPQRCDGVLVDVYRMFFITRGHQIISHTCATVAKLTNTHLSWVAIWNACYTDGPKASTVC